MILDIQRVLLLLRVALRYGTRPVLRRIASFVPDPLSPGVRLRLALGDLGLAYVKLGQFLAMRFDILPVEVCRELNALFEAASPMSFEQVQSVIESELKQPLFELFPIFKVEPIASASVGQVHEAYTAAGDRVAVKVQRIDAERPFLADMRNLRRLARLIDASGIGGVFSVAEIVDEFTYWTRREMNFLIEGRTAERLRTNAAPYEIVPKISWSLTTERVLTMEFIEGMTLARISQLVDTGQTELIDAQLPNLDLATVGRHVAFAILRQLFVFGFFQGDPHPGNVFIRNDNTVAFVDFGIFGELTNEARENFAAFLEYLALGNIDESFRYFVRQHTPTAATDMKAFEREAKAILRQWYRASTNQLATPEERHMARYAVAMINVIRRHHLQMDTAALLLWRALYVLDATAERLATYFDMMGQMRTFFREIRPGPLERIGRIVNDPRQSVALVGLLLAAPAGSQRIARSVSRADSAWQVQGEAARRARQSDRDRARAVTLTVVGASVSAALGAGLLHGVAAEALLGTLAAAASVFLFTQVKAT